MFKMKLGVMKKYDHVKSKIHSFENMGVALHFKKKDILDLALEKEDDDWKLRKTQTYVGSHSSNASPIN
jgi:hypothetical protein